MISIRKLKSMNHKAMFFNMHTNCGEVENFPVLLTLMPSFRCNYNCIYCSQNHKDTTEMPETVIEQIKTIAPYVSEININGGEPFLYDKLNKIFDIIAENNLRSTIVSNGSLLNEHTRNMILESGLGLLKISFDGGTAKTYEAIRRHGQFSHVVKNIIEVSKLKLRHGVSTPRLQFNVVAMRQNVGELTKLVGLASNIGVEQIDVQYCRFDLERDVEQCLYFHKEYADHHMQLAREAARRLGIVFNTPHLFSEPSPTEDQAFVRARCAFPWQTLSIGPDGACSLCCGHVQGYGNLAQQDFWEVWNHPFRVRVRQTVNTAQELDICRNCSYGAKQDPNILASHIPNPAIAEKARGKGKAA